MILACINFVQFLYSYPHRVQCFYIYYIPNVLIFLYFSFVGKCVVQVVYIIKIIARLGQYHKTIYSRIYINQIKQNTFKGHFGRDRRLVERKKKKSIHQILVSRSKSLLPSKPIQALRKLSRALRCLLRLLTTSVPSYVFE